jgi:uncharacterized membrane protein
MPDQIASRDSARSRRISIDRTGILVGLAMAALWTWLSWARYRNFWSSALDLSIFDQGIWLLSRGQSPEVTVIGKNLFADHLSPVLLLFVPLYRLTATPFWLFAVQAALLGATVIPMRAFARLEGAPPWLATASVGLSAPLAAAAFFDFHPSTLAVPAVAWTLLAARRGDVRQCTIAGLAVLLCRADLGWVLLGIAVVAPSATRRRLVTMAPIALAAGVVVPALWDTRSTWELHYGHLGSGVVDVLLHPWRIAAAAVSPDAITTLLIWLLPVALLPIVRPRWFVAVVIAGLPVLVSRWAGAHLPYFHYGAPIAPIAIGGALVASVRCQQLRERGPVLLVGGALSALALMSPFAAGAPDSLRVWRVLRSDEAARHAAGAAIGNDEAVSAAPRVLAHLAHRDEAWIFPSPFRQLKPAAVGPEPSASYADRVRVVVVDAARRGEAQQLGFQMTAIGSGRYYLGRR